MMEQLAERRMQREEEAQYAAAGLRHPSFGPHDHAPIDEDEYGEDEGDDYASEDEDEYEEDMVCKSIKVSLYLADQTAGRHDGRATHGGRS